MAVAARRILGHYGQCKLQYGKKTEDKYRDKDGDSNRDKHQFKFFDVRDRMCKDGVIAEKETDRLTDRLTDMGKVEKGYWA